MSVIGQRVTQRSQTAATMRGLEASLGRAQRLQEQLSSGRQVSKPSDDPSAAVSAMKLRSQRSANEQYLRNIQNVQGRLNVTDGALQDLSAQVRKVQELVISARNPAQSPSALSAIATELDQIRSGVIDTYNTRWLDRPVFGGTVPGTVAVDPDGTYVGNDVGMEARVSRAVAIRVDVTGTSAGADELPALIAQAAENVLADDKTALGADLTQLDAVLSKVLTVLGDIGARAGQLEKTEAAVDSERLDFTARISENEEIDLPKTIMELNAAKVAYEASLGAAAKIMQTSLLDFLR